MPRIHGSAKRVHPSRSAMSESRSRSSSGPRSVPFLGDGVLTPIRRQALGIKKPDSRESEKETNTNRIVHRDRSPCLPSTATEQTTWNPEFRPGPHGSGRDSAWSCLPWPWRRPLPPRESPSPRSTPLRRPRRRSTPGAATSEGSLPSLPSIRASPLIRPPGRRPRHPDECGRGSFDSVETTTRPPEGRPGRRRCRSRSIVRSCRDPGGTRAGYSHPGSSWISTVTSKPACAT